MEVGDSDSAEAVIGSRMRVWEKRCARCRFYTLGREVVIGKKQGKKEEKHKHEREHKGWCFD